MTILLFIYFFLFFFVLFFFFSLDLLVYIPLRISLYLYLSLPVSLSISYMSFAGRNETGISRFKGLRNITYRRRYFVGRSELVSVMFLGCVVFVCVSLHLYQVTAKHLGDVVLDSRIECLISC
jgi:hypothetical protein